MVRKESDLDEGLCAECKWEAEVGLKLAAHPAKKHSFWGFLKKRNWRLPAGRLENVPINKNSGLEKNLGKRIALQ